MRARLVLCALLLAACSESHGPDAGLELDAGEALPDFEPYHLEETRGAVSLGLDREGGTFRHAIDACSIAASTDGRLVDDGETLRLLPAEGSSGIGWFSVGLTGRVPEVRLRPNERGLTAEFDVDGVTMQEQWLTGGICPDCEAGGALMPCDNPFGG